MSYIKWKKSWRVSFIVHVSSKVSAGSSRVKKTKVLRRQACRISYERSWWVGLKFHILRHGDEAGHQEQEFKVLTCTFQNSCCQTNRGWWGMSSRVKIQGSYKTSMSYIIWKVLMSRFQISYLWGPVNYHGKANFKIRQISLLHEREHTVR